MNEDALHDLYNHLKCAQDEAKSIGNKTIEKEMEKALQLWSQLMNGRDI